VTVADTSLAAKFKLRMFNNCWYSSCR